MSLNNEIFITIKFLFILRSWWWWIKWFASLQFNMLITFSLSSWSYLLLLLYSFFYVFWISSSLDLFLNSLLKLLNFSLNSSVVRNYAYCTNIGGDLNYFIEEDPFKPISFCSIVFWRSCNVDGHSESPLRYEKYT